MCRVGRKRFRFLILTAPALKDGHVTFYTKICNILHFLSRLIFLDFSCRFQQVKFKHYFKNKLAEFEQWWEKHAKTVFEIRKLN